MMHFELPKTFHKTPIALDLSSSRSIQGILGWARIGLGGIYWVMGGGGGGQGETHTLLL